MQPRIMRLAQDLPTKLVGVIDFFPNENYSFIFGV